MNSIQYHLIAYSITNLLVWLNQPATIVPVESSSFSLTPLYFLSRTLRAAHLVLPVSMVPFTTTKVLQSGCFFLLFTTIFTHPLSHFIDLSGRNIFLLCSHFIMATTFCLSHLHPILPSMPLDLFNSIVLAFIFHPFLNYRCLLPFIFIHILAFPYLPYL